MSELSSDYAELGADIDAWIERYAELLGCDPRPGAVAAAIESLKAERDAAVRSIPEHRRAAEDALIRYMRRTAVNCGQSASCAVAHWCETSEEKKAQAARNGGG